MGNRRNVRPHKQCDWVGIRLDLLLYGTCTWLFFLGCVENLNSDIASVRTSDPVPVATCWRHTLSCCFVACYCKGRVKGALESRSVFLLLSSLQSYFHGITFCVISTFSTDKIHNLRRISNRYRRSTVIPLTTTCNLSNLCIPVWRFTMVINIITSLWSIRMSPRDKRKPLLHPRI